MTEDRANDEQPAYKIVGGWAIYETVDERGRTGGCVGYALDKQAADTFAKGKGWYGGYGDVKPLTFLCLDGKYFPLHEGAGAPCTIQTEGQSLRAQGLAKLSEAEKEALGLL